MSTTTTEKCPSIVRAGDREGELYLLDIPVEVTGTYDSASRPNFNIYTALGYLRQGITAVKVKSVYVFRDSNIGGTRRTATNIALSTVTSGSTSDKVTFRIESTSGSSINGTGTGEIADTTSCSEWFRFMALVEVTRSEL